MMIIKMIGLYHMDHQKAYFRKIGDCFDFVSRIEYASQLTKNEVESVLSQKNWYLDQYNAEMLVVIHQAR